VDRVADPAVEAVKFGPARRTPGIGAQPASPASLASEAKAVDAGDLSDELRAAHRPDSGLGEQLWSRFSDHRLKLACQLV